MTCPNTDYGNLPGELLKELLPSMETYDGILWHKPLGRSGWSFLKPFYDMGVREKYETIAPFLEQLDPGTLVRLANAILQHSSAYARKHWSVKHEGPGGLPGVRKLSKTATIADLRDKESSTTHEN